MRFLRIDKENIVLEKMGRGVEIAEEHRDKRKHHGFVADLFYGKAPFEDLFPWPEASEAEAKLRREAAVTETLRAALASIDAEEIERTRSIQPEIIENLSRNKFFAMKVPQVPWGGLELGQAGYNHAMELAASLSSAIWILLSADNTIGAKFPVLKYGTPHQRARFLPHLVRLPSGFCFTENDVGSDPARMETYAQRVWDADGVVTGYEITGDKRYITNSALDDNTPLAEYLAVVAKIVDRPEEALGSKCFGMFIVPADNPGKVVIGPRNHFSGMRGIHNANPSFKGVYADASQRIGKEGEGFRIALEALNTGRIAIAAGALAQAKQALLAMRWRAARREQWGKRIERHELIGSGMLARSATQIFAMEALVEYAGTLVDRGEDCRLVAALTKVFTTERGWQVIDDMMQLFGGSGYETFETLSPREKTAPVERMWRDARPNRIFEGSTQILSQWCIREGFDHLISLGKVLLEPENLLRKGEAVSVFAQTYLTLLWPSGLYHNRNLPGNALSHLRFVERNARRFVRAFIMKAAQFRKPLPPETEAERNAVYSISRRDKVLAERQRILERFFWIMAELAAMSASCAYAARIASEVGNEAWQLCDAYCRGARLRIRRLYAELSRNDDDELFGIACGIRAGRYRFLERHIIPWVDLNGQ